jgi:putative inorganic carbon (hco3(-)) transporter
MLSNARTASRRHGFWTRHLLLQKLASPVGAGLLVIAALLFSLVIAYAGLSAGVVLLGAIIGLPVVAACLVDLRFGVMFLTTISFFLLEAKKIVDIPFGIFLDAGILLLFIGVLFRQASQRDWSFANNPISWWVLIWISLNMLQVLNPVAASREAWMYTVRGMAGTIVFYYIILYTLTDLAYALRLLKLVIFLGFLAGAFSMYQEFVGLTPWEYRWMMSDIEIYKLIFQAGRIRLFSFLSDPTTFGIMMAYMLVLCFTLAFGPWKPRTKILLVLGSIVMLLGCFWSGTPHGLHRHSRGHLLCDPGFGGQTQLAVGSFLGHYDGRRRVSGECAYGQQHHLPLSDGLQTLQRPLLSGQARYPGPH